MTGTIKTTELNNAGVLDGTERLALVQAGVSKQATTLQIAALVSPLAIPAAANTVLAGPVAGPADYPSYRALVAADIPVTSVTVTVGSTVVSGGTNSYVLYDNGGVVGQYATSGTGSVAMTNAPTFVTPNLGTPSAAVLTNATGLPVGSGISGLGAGVATFLATPSSANLATAVADETGSGALVFATSPSLTTPNLGTPSAATLTNATGLPVSTGIAGLGAGVATFLATPSSANLAAAVTGETGSGALVFGTSPGFTTAANPATNDGASLGINGTAWSDLFLASGGVINFNSGDVTLTQSAANTLALAGATQFSFTQSAAIPQFLFNRTDTHGSGVGTGRFDFFGTNASGTSVQYSSLLSIAEDDTAGAEDGAFYWQTLKAGVNATRLQLVSTALQPGVNNDLTLGASSRGWSNVFIAASGALTFGTSSDVTFTHSSDLITMAGGGLKLTAGTATIAPLALQSGTNLTSAAAGSVEYDGVQVYGTIDTSSGRGAIPVEQYFHLTAAGSTISTIANFFGTSSNIALVASAYYIIDVYCYFLKTTAGTVTWTLTNSAAPTGQNIMFEMSPITGIVAPPGTATMLAGQYYNDATAARTIVTGSLTDAVNHYAHFRIHLRNGAGTSLKIQATCSAGTITPGINSYWFARRVSPNNIGTFAA